MKTKERIPLLKDHHTHPFLYSSLQSCPDIRFVDDKSKAVELIGRSCIQDGINAVIGWNDSRYLFTEAELNAFPPLVLLNSSLHYFVMNDAAAELVGSRFPALIDNRGNREWIERNGAQLFGFIMGIRPCNVERLTSFYGTLSRSGVWYAEEMTMGGTAGLAVFDRAGLSDRTLFWADAATIEGLGDEELARVHGLKLFTDGALGARTARLLHGFLGGETGVLIYDDDELLSMLSWGAELGKAVAIHAIGDVAVEQAVIAVSRLNRRPTEIRMEHCQFISRQAAEKAKALGIVLCMQPNFSFESSFYRDRLPECYLAANNPFRMLIDDAGFVPGRDLLFGSDGMPHGVQYALESALFPPFPGQTLSLDEFVAGYCMPDLENGFIDIVIDLANRKISTEVTLRTAAETLR
ncbi:MAG TPA: amidohydrolase family protein [Geobacteraceae bacterium]|nr:amidohydrolase family protein [Geobacteraceae bacterium]